MKLFVSLITLSIIALWIALGFFLLGQVDIPGIQLSLPKTTSDFSDSTGILNGLFSSFAVVLALIALLIQGRELRESTSAQNEQVAILKDQLQLQRENSDTHIKSLARQLMAQQKTHEIMLLQSRYDYHVKEMDRMDAIIQNIKGTKRDDNLFQNCVDKKNRHKNEMETIQNRMDALM